MWWDVLCSEIIYDQTFPFSRCLCHKKYMVFIIHDDNGPQLWYRREKDKQAYLHSKMRGH